MNLNVLAQFSTEIGLILLAGVCVFADLFMQRGAQKGRALATVAMAGLAILLAVLALTWGRFGASFGGAFVQDGFSWLFKGIFLVTGIFVLAMAREFESSLKKSHGEFIILILFALIGMSFLVSANEFLLFFVALETLTLSLYIITAYMREDDRSIEAGIKFVILGALSTAITLYGLSFIYGATGATTYLGIQQAVVASGVTPVFTFGMLLVLAGIFFKIAVFPFQFWVPDVYEGAPAPITAFLAMGSKAAGFAALTRLLLTVFMPAQNGFLVTLFAVLAACTVIYGNLGAMLQKNVKRLLAYSSIGHAGYLMIGIAAFLHSGKEAVAYYLITYVFSTAGAFLVVVWISNKLKSDDISAFAGLSKRSPVLAAGMLIALFSLAGVPPLAGFFAKFYILSSAVKAGLVWLAAVGLLNVVTSLYYYLSIVKAMYVDKPVEDTPFRVSLTQKFFQYVTMAGILILGVYPTPVLKLVDAAFLNFLRF